MSKNSMLGLSEVCVQHAHAANEHRHLWGSKRQQLRLVNQQHFGWDRVLDLEVVAEAVCNRFE
jgi:hypothetical protein